MRVITLTDYLLLKKENAKLKASLTQLAELFDADAEGKPSINWYSNADLRRRARRANKLLGREAKIGSNENES